MLELFKKLFTKEDQPREPVDVQRIIRQIKEAEEKKDIPLGKRIHSFSYVDFQLNLDRDITEHYRITVYQGQERIYSFTIFAKERNYDILEQAYSQIITFMEGDRNIGSLPDDEILKGFFYGH